MAVNSLLFFNNKFMALVLIFFIVFLRKYFILLYENKFIFLFLFIISIKINAQQNAIPVGSILRTHALIYGEMFEGRKTAGGEIFNNDSLTCSHRTLPFNTMLYITNAVNGKTVILRVNDRGLNPKSTDIFVTKQAAIKLGLPRQGGTKITMQIIGENGLVLQEDEKSMTFEAEVLRQNNLKAQKIKSSPPIVEKETTEGKYNFDIKPFEENNNDTSVNKTYALDGSDIKLEGFGIQLFSVDNLKSAQSISKTLIEGDIDSKLYIQQVWVKGKKVFRIIAGAYGLIEAKEHLNKLKKIGHKGFIQKHLSA